MKHVMIDIEAFGNGKYACLTQIGAAYFDPKTGKIGPQFFDNIDARDAQREGGEIDADTVYWWLSQSPEAIASILKKGQPLRQTMLGLNEFLSKAECVWSHATYDFVVITEVYKKLGIEPKFSYRTARDIRTLMSLSGHKKHDRKAGVAHNALDDCLFQIEYCVEAMKKLGVHQ